MFPCLAKNGGNCQEAVMLVEELAVKWKAVGGCDGTVLTTRDVCLNSQMIIDGKFKKEHVINHHGKPNRQSILIKSSVEDHLE